MPRGCPGILERQIKLLVQLHFITPHRAFGGVFGGTIADTIKNNPNRLAVRIICFNFVADSVPCSGVTETI